MESKKLAEFLYYINRKNKDLFDEEAAQIFVSGIICHCPRIRGEGRQEILALADEVK